MLTNSKQNISNTTFVYGGGIKDYKIIPNRQTPKTKNIIDVKKFIREHSVELDEFLSFAKSLYGAAALSANQVSNSLYCC